MDHHHHPNSADPDTARLAALTAWLATVCSSTELALVRDRIAVHEQRLQHLEPDLRTEAVVDALLRDATTDPILAGALHRLQRRSLERRQNQAASN